MLKGSMVRLLEDFTILMYRKPAKSVLLKNTSTCTGLPISWQTWVGLTLICAVPVCSAWADGKLAEVAEQVTKMVEHPKSE